MKKKGSGLWCLTPLVTIFQLYHGGNKNKLCMIVPLVDIINICDIGLEFELWCLMLISTIFQLYRGSQFYWWRNLEKKPLVSQ
jgi:hypothetical protein